jgi:hypothetical protein
MGAKKKAAKAGAAATAVKENPALQRLIEDDEVRDQIRVAYDASKDAYSRLTNGKTASKAILEDKKLHKDLHTAAEALREAGAALKQGPAKKRKGGLGRFLLFGIVGAGLALAVSSDLRSKVLDALFGAEEEFDYTSTTTPSTSPSSAATPAGSTS